MTRLLRLIVEQGKYNTELNKGQMILTQVYENSIDSLS